MRTEVIAPGTYVIARENAVRFQNDVMAGVYGDNPYSAMFNHRHAYESAWDFSGEHDLLIIADGVTLLTDGFMTALDLSGCKNVTVRGLTIDCKRRPYTMGVVDAVGDSTFDIRFPSGTGASPRMPAPRFVIMDREGKHVLKVITASVEGNPDKKAVGDGVIRFPYALDACYVGCPAAVLHTWHGCPSILLEESENVTLEQITVHSHPGMGIVGHRSANITLDGVRIVPPDGSFISTNTDASHFSSCRGALTLRNCTFSGSGDDCINIHSYYQTVREQLGDRTYRLKVMVRFETHSLHLDHPDVGEEVLYVHTDDMQPCETYRVVSCEPDYDTYSCTVTLDRPLPEDCIGNLIACYGQFPKVTVKGCRFSDHLARGMLIQDPCGAVVEDCDFSYCYENAVFLSADPFYHESAPCSDITVRNCHMTGCGLKVNCLAPKKERPIHKNITVDHNVIDGRVSLSSIDGLVFTDNLTTVFPEIKDCLNVRQSGNTVTEKTNI